MGIKARKTVTQDEERKPYQALKRRRPEMGLKGQGPGTARRVLTFAFQHPLIAKNVNLASRGVNFDTDSPILMTHDRRSRRPRDDSLWSSEGHRLCAARQPKTQQLLGFL
ncbi:hypothetical protein SKAU_G00297550 [Synaphobranchus kaupii]|uniref:Uncharacterized protein n=1 Tax=Synaphobranchus kaupii TaxID=118154 RepID=A0A9Q1EV02_SYNKA|nr:hypothetical protein SKAU_G00297550 [Synaphobranchus kaupii]